MMTLRLCDRLWQPIPRQGSPSKSHCQAHGNTSNFTVRVHVAECPTINSSNGRSGANRPVAIACPSNGIAHNAGAEFNPPVEPDFDILPNANNGIRKREDAMNRPLWEAITWRK